MSDIKTIALIGIGFMGKQIINHFVLYDNTIRIFDIYSEELCKIAGSLTRKKKRKNISGEVTEHQNLSEAIADANLIIEAIPERIELKKEVFSLIDKPALSHSIIATNSSSILVSKIEDVVERKDKILNMHFYIPKTVPMVDIMRGSRASNETFNKGKQWIESIDNDA